jgi:hypothetical protein
MWNSKRSVTLSILCTRVVIALAIVVAALLLGVTPETVNLQPLAIDGVVNAGTPVNVMKYVPVYYSVLAPGLVALFFLNSLLVAIRKSDVFTRANVRCLRVISWCCFIAGAVFAGFAPHTSLILFFVAAAACFIGLIVRVLKNVLQAGVELKDENDYTI